MSDTLKGTYEDGARQSPPPRTVITNSISRAIKSSLKGQSDALVERAIRQAHREADLLYMLLVHINAAVQESIEPRKRECLFLIGYLKALESGPITSVVEDQLRTLTLMLVEEILLVDCAISQVRSEQFDGHPVLFSDSAFKLKALLDIARVVLEYFNRWAKLLSFTQLTVEEICEKLRPAIDTQVGRWTSVARGYTLAAFGEVGEFRANLDEFIRSENGANLGCS
jgi:hypothetical protein